MMGENPNYWWSLNGKLPSHLPPPSQQAYPTYNFSPPPPPPLQPVAPLPAALLNPPPYLFGSSLLVPAAANSNFADHHHHDNNQDFPVSWSQLLLSGLASEEEQTLNPSSIRIGATHVGEAKHDSLHQQSRQISYTNRDEHGDDNHNKNNNNNEEDEMLQACSSSWSSQLNPTPSIGSSSTTSLSTNTSIFDFSSKIKSRNQHTNQYLSQCDETSTSGACKKHRFQPSSTQPSSVACNDTLTSGTSKKARVQHASTQPPLKVRKEKLGDRISALHQLVSPFGKTDTASVLLEATVHIRFLEGQIEALSSPCMNLSNNVSGNTRHQHSDGKEPPKDLKSRGLCLVPTSCIDHIDTTNMTNNGAEFWTPALGGGF